MLDYTYYSQASHVLKYDLNLQIIGSSIEPVLSTSQYNGRFISEL